MPIEMKAGDEVGPRVWLAQRRKAAGPGLMSREQRTRRQEKTCVGVAHNDLRLALVPEMSKRAGVAERRRSRDLYRAGTQSLVSNSQSQAIPLPPVSKASPEQVTGQL